MVTLAETQVYVLCCWCVAWIIAYLPLLC